MRIYSRPGPSNLVVLTTVAESLSEFLSELCASRTAALLIKYIVVLANYLVD